MLKEMKPGRKYFIINLDEPYAKEIYEILKRGQMAKGDWPEGDISFEEWKAQTFNAKQAIQPGAYCQCSFRKELKPTAKSICLECGKEIK